MNSVRRMIPVLSAAIVLIAADAAGRTLIRVETVEQEHSQWCWAGVARSVLSLYGSPPEQCDIAEWARAEDPSRFGTDDCCAIDDAFDSTHACNDWNYYSGFPGSLDDILAFRGVENTPMIGNLSFEEYAEVIAEGRPVIIRWTRLPANTGHFVVGHGVGPDQTAYYMNPWPGEGALIGDYTWLVAGLESDDEIHQWMHTIVVTPPAPAGKVDMEDEIAPDDAADSEKDCGIARWRKSESGIVALLVSLIV